MSPPSDQSSNLPGLRGSDAPLHESSQHPELPRTPTKTNLPKHPVEATPARIHSTLSHDYQNAGIKAMRDAIVRDIGHWVPMVSYELFARHFLPPLKEDIDVDGVVSALKDIGWIVNKDNNDCWKDFWTAPYRNPDKEDVVFTPFEKICKEAVRLAGNHSGRNNTFVLRLLPNNAPQSERSSTIRPDCYFIKKPAEEKASRARKKVNKVRWWYDIAVTGEFKKRVDEAGLVQNRKQILFNMQQTMTLDPCRRFTFGITTENTSMRLWFVSRSTPVTTEEFDFTTDPKRLLHVFLSFAFASDVEMGWDSSIIPFLSRYGIRQYYIWVGNQKFVTEKVLSDFAADALLSRATRVWVAKKFRSKSNARFVVKDYWVDDKRYSDSEIYSMLLRDVEATHGAIVGKDVSSHLLTPIAEWFVPAGGKVDHTMSVMMCGYSSSFSDGIQLMNKVQKATSTNKSIGPSAASDLQTHPKTRIQCLPTRKRHHRIVFEEQGEALYTVKKLSDVFIVLRDCAKVLKLVHSSGWVHRDIGVANVYLYEGRGVLGDLEYAKRKRSEVTHDVRSCTTDCMANEAIKGSYEYAKFSPDGELGSFLRLWEDFRIRQDVPTPTLKNIPPFYHNDLHDLESLWWAAVWMLFFNCLKNDPQSNENELHDADEKRANFAALLFPRDHTTRERQEFFDKDKAFKEMTSWMSSKALLITKILDALRWALKEKYMKFESRFPEIMEGEFEGIHDFFHNLFDKCREVAKGIELIPFTSSEIQHPLSIDFDENRLPNNRADGRPEWDLMEGDKRMEPKEAVEEALPFQNVAEEYEEVGDTPLLEGGDAACKSAMLSEGNSDADFLTPMPPIRIRYGAEAPPQNHSE